MSLPSALTGLVSLLLERPLGSAATALSLLFTVLFVWTACVDSKLGVATTGHSSASFPTFKLKKELTVKDKVFLELLALESKSACFVITDPDLDDNPIVFSSEGFCHHTQYSYGEVVGRNCRFLQGKETKPEDIAAIKNAILLSKEVTVQLLNYRKDGTTFVNQFFLTPLRLENGTVAYYVGVQKEVEKAKGPSQDGENEGWRLFMWI